MGSPSRHHASPIDHHQRSRYACVPEGTDKQHSLAWRCQLRRSRLRVIKQGDQLREQHPERRLYSLPSNTAVLQGPVELEQYVSLAFGQVARDAGIARSMGSKGDCYDNAVAESFFATLECELLDRYPWPTRTGLRTAIFDFIEVFYNRQRRHSTLDYATPVLHEQQHASPAPAA
jgi:transposase InsO family protein